MRTILASTIITFTSWFILVAAATAYENNEINIGRIQKGSDNQLKSYINNFYIDWNDINDTPQWIRNIDSDIEWKSNNYTERTYEFLELYGDLYRINEPRNVFESLGEYEDQLSMRHVILQQTYHGIAVYGAQQRFHFKPDGTLSSINGKYSKNVSRVDTIPMISEDQAIDIAKNKFKDDIDINGEIRQKLKWRILNQGIYI